MNKYLVTVILDGDSEDAVSYVYVVDADNVSQALQEFMNDPPPDLEDPLEEVTLTVERLS